MILEVYEPTGMRVVQVPPENVMLELPLVTQATVLEVIVPGPPGPIGPPGPVGEPGTTRATKRWGGYGAPTVVIGAQVGDEYLDFQTGNLFTLQ